VSIQFQNVMVRTRGTTTPVVMKNLDFRIEKHDHVALLAPPHGGLELVVDVLCGAGAAESGRVVRETSISWPLPNSKFLHQHQTFVGNARFIARLYEMEQAPFISKVIEMAGIQDIADERVSYCPRKAVSSFGFALGACLPFDTYLFTSMNIGGREDKEKYAQIVHELGNNRGLLIATSNGKTAEPFCDKAFVLEDDGAVYYDDMEAAIAHLQRITPRAEDTPLETELSIDDERVFDDF
jgi:capsular polysaccharide transport system ATP-binding protein